MGWLRVLLIVLFLSILGYTAIVVSHDGWGLLPEFIGAILEQSWQGQFNLDFSFFLLLSAIWISWRHGFSWSGYGLAGFALVGGMLFLAPYLLVILAKSQGQAASFLLGKHSPS
ncbi:MAG: hypothetical protein AB8C46_14850 [Burkholderiaceae bacterium]